MRPAHSEPGQLRARPSVAAGVATEWDETDGEALDAYSLAVVSVAEAVLPSVASLRVRVGINAAVAGVGLGLAVPVNATTQRIIGALMTEGRVRRA